VNAELRIDEHRTTLIPRSASNKEPFGKLTQEYASMPEALQAAAPSSRFLVSFTGASSFDHTMEIPVRARREADRILKIEAERLTPFDLKDMLRFWWTEEAARGVTRAHQVLVKRDVADNIGKMVRNVGHSITAFGYRGPGNDLSPMLLEADGTVYGSSQERLWKLASVFALALFVGVGAWSAFSANKFVAARSSDLQTGSEALESRAKDVRQQFDAQKETENLVVRLMQKRKSAPHVSQSLSELTRLLPDTAWVQLLSLRGDRIQIDGEALNAEALIRTLDESASFTDVKFTTPVYSIAPSGKQRFSISMAVESVTE
jgi:general secretion pathway protein L